MRRIKIEFQVTILTVIVVMAVMFSGYLVYQSLSQIVNSIHKEARPDFKLLLIKDISSDLTEIENTVRLYTITHDEKYFHPYQETSQSIQKKLIELKDYSLTNADEGVQIDSINSLTNEKLKIWQQILSLHHEKEDTHESFSKLYTKIDSAKAKPDTVVIEKPEKKGGLFGFLKSKKKKQEEQEPEQIQHVDSSAIEKETIKQEIAEIEQKIQDTHKELSSKEKTLLEQNIQLTDLLNEQIDELERTEQKKLMQKTQDADMLAALTYKRLAIFTIAAVVLMLMVLFLFFRYLNQSRAYQTILRKAKTEAEKLARAKELFVATVSHEMRTPINAIYGLTEQLIQKMEPGKNKKDLEIIHRSTEHLISLVNDTLDFSKIETQKLELNPVDFSLDNLLDEVYTLNKGNANAKQLELMLEKQDLPALVLKGDAFRLKQILINLINNAVKFTDEGQVTLKVHATKKTVDQYWVTFQVIDTGIGISSENHDLIFDDFVQLETDLTKKQSGAGLGLSIVKKLVDIQGGTISIESELHQGTTITIEIPYELGDPDRIQVIQQKEIVIPEEYKKLSALIVDDEQFNRYLLRNILEKWGVHVAECENGQEAVEVSANRHFDLIFMDVRMPVLNGLDASQQITRARTDARIIALTASNKKEDIEKCTNSGMNYFLSKPFAEKDLFNVFQQAIGINSKPTPNAKKKSIQSVDLSELEHMANGDPSFVKEMIEIFIRSSESGLKSIRKSLKQQDWEHIAEYAHKMAAPAKHMKATSLYAKIKEMEREAEKTKDSAKMNQLYNEIELEVVTTNNFLKDLLQKKFKK
ncbi:MAG TPA: response regulator [Sunxiuqinia sp.]|nr:response regulator [Sunxiuqinia sp.]